MRSLVPGERQDPGRMRCKRMNQSSIFQLELSNAPIGGSSDNDFAGGQQGINVISETGYFADRPGVLDTPNAYLASVGANYRRAVRHERDCPDWHIVSRMGREQIAGL